MAKMNHKSTGHACLTYMHVKIHSTHSLVISSALKKARECSKEKSQHEQKDMHVYFKMRPIQTTHCLVSHRALKQAKECEKDKQQNEQDIKV